MHFFAPTVIKTGRQGWILDCMEGAVEIIYIYTHTSNLMQVTNVVLKKSRF